MFPALKRVVSSSNAGTTATALPTTALPTIVNRHRCEDEHVAENAQFEELGRLLGDVRARIRRGARGVEALTTDLAQVADRLARAMSRHMAREESEVLPPLMKSLCLPEQRHMVWRLVRAMPLRLLERVMPWVAGKLREDDVNEWLYNIKRAAPVEEAALVKLLEQWARRGLAHAAHAAPDDEQQQQQEEEMVPRWRRGTDDPAAYSIETCTPANALVVGAGGGCGEPHLPPVEEREEEVVEKKTVGAMEYDDGGDGVGKKEYFSGTAAPPLKRIRTAAAGNGDGDGASHHHHHHLLLRRQSSSLPHSPHTTAAATATATAAATATMHQDKPIDHIFQFHKALRREIKELEADVIEVQSTAEGAVGWVPGDTLCRSIQDLQAKFQFLRGIYRAHSSAEDEVIFPALEAKETLHNVSHSYALDHQQEESLFDGIAEVIDGIKKCRPCPQDLPTLRSLSSRLSRMCAAVRAALETHVRAEENELWPLFVENFTIEEQQHLVGVIIGRTGAEVLQAMMSWVKGEMNEDEHNAMMSTIKLASKSTSFEQWLETLENEKDAGTGTGVGAGATGGNGGSGGSGGENTKNAWEEEQEQILAEVAKYLAKHGLVSTHVTATAGTAATGGTATNVDTTTPVGVGGSGGGNGIFSLATTAATTTANGDNAPTAMDPANFRPGWEDLFRMNQKQLELAVRRVSADSTLEPHRKAYLIQHLMASRYIVAQQRRGSIGSGSTAATPTTARLPPPQQPPPQPQVPVDGESPPPPNTTKVNNNDSNSVPYRHFYDPPTNSILGCKHYRRRAMLIAPCCGQEHVCRLCHDETVSGHSLDRYSVAEMRCMECGSRQPVASTCATCAAPMARYYCSICHLFDDDPHRDIYHCPFCNFCRRGKGLGVDSFHCMSCNACMSLELFNKHRCTESALAGTCPVCSDSLFDSSAPIKEMPCGHFMHSMCFAAYTRYSYTCPVCSKSLGDMAVYWKMIDSLLGGETLPEEYAARRQMVLCNDCGIETNAPFHFVYHKCSGCGGYNTRLL